MIRRTLAASTVLVAATLTMSMTSSATVLASAAAAPATDRAAAYTVDAHVNRTEPLVGDVVKVKGTVSPGAPGAKVKLQVKYADKKWKTIDQAALSQNGKFKFKDKVATVRERTYRVVKPGNRQHASGRATTEKVTVYGWRTLTSLTPAITNLFLETGSVTINGVAYPDSLTTFNGSAAFSVDYNLNRKCTAIEARYGVGDSSPVGSSATLSLAVDGVQKYSGSFGLTQSALDVTDVTDAFRVTLGGTATGNATAVVATPRVLCSF